MLPTCSHIVLAKDITPFMVDYVFLDTNKVWDRYSQRQDKTKIILKLRPLSNLVIEITHFLRLKPSRIQKSIEQMLNL